MRLVPLKAEDAEIAAALHAMGFPDPWPAEAFISLLGDPLRSGAIAVAADEPCGLILLQKTPDEAEILTLVVSPKHRRQGAGRELMNWAIDVADNAGLERLILEVSEQNQAARRLYAGVGFTEIGRRSGYYARAKGVETALIMARSVVRPLSNR
jgi:[ribosomal protein S18]-alanine N-acetyltransferase